MEVYLVRHGQTAYNKKRIHQPDDAVLTDTGRQQAQKVIDQLKSFAPTHLISSTIQRAVETADIINESLMLPREPSALFVELRRPERIMGKPYIGFSSLLYTCRWFFSRAVVDDSVTIGESRRSFSLRLLAARQYLESYSADAHVVVVTHSIFIDFFVTSLRQQKISLWHTFVLLLKIKRLKNTSITHLRYEVSPSGMARWDVISLGEVKTDLYPVQ